MPSIGRRDDLAFEIGKVISYAINDVTGDDPSARASASFTAEQSVKHVIQEQNWTIQAGVARLPEAVCAMTEPGLSAAEHARLNSFMLDIAGAARGTPIADGSGNYRFGGKGRALRLRERAISRLLGRGARARPQRVSS